MQNIINSIELEMRDVREHYDSRLLVSKRLKRLLLNANHKDFSDLALGIDEPMGNYSASEHNLGEKILASSDSLTIFNFAKTISNPSYKAKNIPEAVYRANIPYLKISVGSEISCMIEPNKYWVANVRTIWAHLLVKHNGNLNYANEELQLYRDSDSGSAMDYRVWKDLYSDMEKTLNILHDVSVSLCKSQNIEAANNNYLWIDAVCSILFETEAAA